MVPWTVSISIPRQTALVVGSTSLLLLIVRPSWVITSTNASKDFWVTLGMPYPRNHQYNL